MMLLVVYLITGVALGLLNWGTYGRGERARLSVREWIVCVLLWPLPIITLALVCVAMAVDRVRFGPLTKRRL